MPLFDILQRLYCCDNRDARTIFNNLTLVFNVNKHQLFLYFYGALSYLKIWDVSNHPKRPQLLSALARFGLSGIDVFSVRLIPIWSIALNLSLKSLNRYQSRSSQNL